MALALLAALTTLSLQATPELAAAPGRDAAHGRDAAPDWIHDVGPLVRRTCAGCHHSEGPAPFRLERYGDVARRARFALSLVREGLMPPWLPDQRGPPLAAPLRVTPDELALLERWVAAGAPRGEGDHADGSRSDDVPVHDDAQAQAQAQAHAQAHAHAHAHADIGADTAGDDGGNGSGTDVDTESSTSTPGTLRIDLDGAWSLPAEGPRDMRSFVLPLANERPLRVSAVAWHCDAPQALHSVTLLGDRHGLSARLDAASEAPGYDAMGDVGMQPSGSHGAVGVGIPRLVLPEGFVFELPAQVDLVAEVHAQPVGRPLELSGAVELTLAQGEVEDPRVLRPLTLLVTSIDVAPGNANHLLQDRIRLPCDVDLVGVLPRAGSVCRSLELTAGPAAPGHTGAGTGAPALAAVPASPRVLLSIPDWNPHYRRPYLYERPVRLQEGTWLTASWHLDNSADNPANPSSPPVRVVLGSEPEQELVQVLLWVAPVEAADRRQLELFHQQVTMERMSRPPR